MASTVYASVTELKAQPDIVQTKHDDFYTLALSAASEAIDGFCGRSLDGFKASTTAIARDYAGSGFSHQYIDETPEITLVELKQSIESTTYSSLTVSQWKGFRGSPSRPNFNRPPATAIMLLPGAPFRVFTSGIVRADPWNKQIGIPLVPSSEDLIQAVHTVRVTAKWGYATVVPNVIKMATIAQAARWIKRGQSFWADASASSDTGRLLYRAVLDPDIEMMLKRSRMVRTAYG